MWPSISSNKDKGVVTGVARVEVHPLAPWMVSVFHVLCLSGSMGHFCWGGDAVKEGRWGGVDRSITVFHIWIHDVSEDRNEAKVGEVVKASSVIGTGCAGSPLWLIILMAIMRWLVHSLTISSRMG